MINNRLELGKYILNNSGSILVNIDDNEQANLRLLIDNIFGEENFVSNIIWRKRAGGGNDSKYIAVEQDYIFFYAKNIDLLVTNGIKRTNIKKYKQDDKGYYLEKPLNETSLQDSAGLHYDIRLPNGKILKGNEHQWKMAKSTFLSRLERDEIIFKSNDKVYYKHYIDINSNLVPSSIWYDLALNADATKDIKNLFGYKNFDTPKPEKLLKRILDIASKENSIILDFFAGSGTTCAVALKLGRKFLGVEMGEHFYKVIIPRLKKVIAGFQSGISKETEYKGGGAFRYYELESYEEALANCEYVLKIGNDKKINSIPYNIDDYYNENIDFYEGIIDYRKSRKLIKKLNKAENKPITINMSAEYREEFDIFQTIANLMNLKIKRLFLDKNGFESCEYDNGEILNIENVDLYKYPKLKSLIWWRE